MRVIILSESLGVFIGSVQGVAIWSTSKFAQKPALASTFSAAKAALDYLHTWDEFLRLPDDMSFPYVETAHPSGVYASMFECMAVGARRWSTD